MIEKTIKQNQIFDGKLFKLYKDEIILPNGNKATREFIEHKGASCILAVTPKNEILFVRQYRYPFKQIMLELPAGKLDGNTPLECAKRELLEETGAIGENFISLGKMYPTVAYSTEVIYLFSCEVTKFDNPNPDEDEFIEIVSIPINKAFDMVLQNEIPDAKTQIAILKFYSVKR